MGNASHSAGVRVVTVAAVALLLGACGSTSNNSPVSKPSVASVAAPVGTSVGVVEREFSITLDKASFTAGTYTFTIKNQGKFPHNLTIEGPGVDKKASATMPGGGSGSVTVNLQKGAYEVWCSVDSHKDKGMDMTLTVG
jgi:uncharacterized cupredoxin-like copper-binding protein